jgi:translation elongation factor EF-1alpha
MLLLLTVLKNPHDFPRLILESTQSWYGSGPSLLERIDALQPPERAVEKPFRLCVADIFKGMGSGICVAGKLESGAVSGGDRSVPWSGPTISDFYVSVTNLKSTSHSPAG